jgi:hypothetical protein
MGIWYNLRLYTRSFCIIWLLLMWSAVVITVVDVDASSEAERLLSFDRF